MADNIVFPQDADYDDAEFFGAQFGWSNQTNYVETGMTLQNYVPSTPAIDVTTGKCFISQANEISSTEGKTVLFTNSVVQVPDTNGLSLTDSAVNNIYVDPDFGTDDNGTVNATTSAVPVGSLKIGEVDTTNDTVTEFNRGPDTTVKNITDYTGTTIYDFSNSYILQTVLQNDSITINAGENLTGGGSVALDGSITLDLVEGDGSQLDADTIKGSDIDVQTTTPSSPNTNDIWVDKQ